MEGRTTAKHKFEMEYSAGRPLGWIDDGKRRGRRRRREKMYGVSRGCTIARPPSAQITEIRRGRGRDRPGKKEDDDSNLAQGSGRSPRHGIASLHSLARDTKQAPMPSRPPRPRTRTPTTDKVFLGTTPFPDVINAISCARPLLREGGLLSLNLF